MGEKRVEKDAFVFPACPSKPRVPSDGEVEALNAMRAIKERARALKDRLQALADESNGKEVSEVTEIQDELHRMRADWEAWEKERQAAARERMILLGHEEDEN